MKDIFESLKAGLAHHQAGRITDAEAAYRVALSIEPEHSYGLYLYGLLCLGTGRLDEAIDLFARSALADPENTDALFNLGNALFRKGEFEIAVEQYSIVTARRPGFADGFANLARALQSLGRTEKAIAAAQKAITLKPGLVEAQANLGTSLLAAGRAQDAIEPFRAVVALRPRDAEAHANLANALHRANQPREAAEAARTAIALNPGIAEAHMLLGTAMRDLGDLKAAETSLKQAIRLRPGYATAYTNLGNVLTDLDHPEEAIAAFKRAIELSPDRPQAHSNLGFLLTDLGRLDEAIAACERAIALDPDYAEAHWNQGFAYLLSGDFERGWDKYEWRKRHPRFVGAYRDFAEPAWTGQDLNGRTLMVYAEQGLGDALQLIRYCELLAARGAQVIVACEKPLLAIFSRVKGVSQVVQRTTLLPPFDYWIDQMSLPRVMGTRVDTIPAPPSYLSADPERIKVWRDRLPAGFKFGLVWAGNPTHTNDRRRSINVDLVRPLAEIPNTYAVSLQVGLRASDVTRFAPRQIFDAAPLLTDFMETAALIANLDLVITVDTAVAHLAGGLGVKTWVMLPLSPDWRWILGRDDSPWYPSMTLYRQTEVGDWTSVIERIARDLRVLAGE